MINNGGELRTRIVPGTDAMGTALKAAAIAVAALAVMGGIAIGITFAVLSTQTTAPAPPELLPLDWWKHCVLYQIYPRSFKDSDGDGIGDLKGIISELEHFVDAGVDAIWMSPIFESPMVDFGYDISNFYKIHYEYGTMEDFEELLKKAHELGIKVLLDFVPNHASTESEYFINSEKKVPGYEDYFVWADSPGPDPNNASVMRPPSNWVSQFGGSAWEWSEARQQFYLHQFAIEQADFNFRNPVVRQEMFNIMEFWLDKGADGFRVDALPYLIEADPADHNGSYPDDPLSGIIHFEPHQLGYTIPLYTKDLIELYDIVYEWREFVDKYLEDHPGDTRVLFSEGYANVTMTMLYYGNEEGAVGAHFPFNFDFITDLSAKSNARDFVYIILRWLTYMPHGGVPNWVFGNHDNNRMPTRFRHNMVDGLNSLNMLLPGVAVTYQGEEIGMRDGYVSWEDTVDVEACNRGDEDTYHLYSRDPARTPYHWNNGTNAGFSTGEKTWLPVADDFKEINLAKQKEDTRSHYKVYQALTALRKEKTLAYGEYDIRALSDRTLYLVRSLPTHNTYVLLFNVADTADTVRLDRVPHLKLPATIYVSSVHSNRLAGATIDGEQVTLQAGEALVLKSDPV
ncbi:PREDICTED: maltase A1-like isoform X1 [Papilio xuthus]|uniref:alpha-glucosidase n=1 Tax=Papilio xuthus TaxID=66420 RepID=A0AAJ6YYC6_PAPXU|nr:PREDICTED: maltase A1-like isoform X1 [Papilio xuthus]